MDTTLKFLFISVVEEVLAIYSLGLLYIGWKALVKRTGRRCLCWNLLCALQGHETLKLGDFVFLVLNLLRLVTDLVTETIYLLINDLHLVHDLTHAIVELDVLLLEQLFALRTSHLSQGTVFEMLLPIV